jgi:serine/threonine protein kinase
MKLFIDNLKTNKQEILVEGKSLTLYELFEFLETDHNLKPFAQGNEGKVYRFGHPDISFSFVIKVMDTPKQTGEYGESFFAQWLSEQVTEKGKSTAFPFFIASYKNMVAYEFIEFASLYPYYLLQHLTTEDEQKKIPKYTFLWKKYQTIMQPSNITPEQRNLCIKSLFLQAIHGLYLIQGINTHGFRHRDLHGQNTMIRKRKTKEPHILSVFMSSGKLMDIILPDFGIELVISDFGLSSYPGIGQDNQMDDPLSDKVDLENFFKPWISTFKQFEWEELATQCENLSYVFKRGFPAFERVMDTDMFKDVFKIIPSMQNPMDLYVPPPPVKRFTKTKEIANEWFSKLQTNVTKLEKTIDPDDSDIELFIRRTERYLKLLRNLSVLMDTENGLRRLIMRLPISIEEIEDLNDAISGFRLSDFRDSTLIEIVDTFNVPNKYLLAFTIKNNLF